MNVLLKIDKGISYVEKTIMIIAIILMATILFANVVGRVVFHHSLTFAEELGTTGTVYVTFVGLSYCARVGEHIAMTAIFDALKGKAKKILMCVICIVVAIGMIWLGYIAVQYIIQLKSQGRVFPITGLSLWKVYLVMPVFIWLTALQYIIILLLNFTDKTGEAVTSIEKITVASVDTEAADEELAEELMESVQGGISEEQLEEEINDEGGAE